MPNYQNGKIYKLICDKTDKIYIGSTVQSLKQRLGLHKSKKTCTSKQLLELGEVKIELIENYSCNTKKELETKERYYIEKYKNIVLNKLLPTRTCKEWHKDNKEYVKQKKKEYHEKNKEHFKQKKKEYREKNKDEIKKKVSIKINCPCGGSTTKNHITRHCKTNKHQNYLKSLNINI